MRNALVLVALVSAPAAVFAGNGEKADQGPEIYGWTNLSLNSVNYEHHEGASNDGELTLTNNTSAIGIRGTEQLKPGLKAVYQWEAGVYWNQHGDNRGLTNLQRDSFVGLDGRYGRLVAGRLPLSNQHAQKSNLFKHQLGTSAEFMAFGGAGMTDASLIPSRISNALRYTVPLAKNIKGSVTYSAEGNDNSDQVSRNEEEDGVGGQLSYKDNLYGVSLTIFEDDLVGAEDAMVALNGSYNYGGGKIVGEYADLGEANAATLGATYRLPNGRFKAQVTTTHDYGDGTHIDDPSMVALGYDHFLSKSTKLYAVAAAGEDGATITGYGYDSSEGSLEGTTGGGLGEFRSRTSAQDQEDSVGLALGMRHTF